MRKSEGNAMKKDIEWLKSWFDDDKSYTGEYVKFKINHYRWGDEAEEEQKYNVQLKVRSSFGTAGIFLYKQGDEVLAGDNLKAYYPEKDEFRLTEQEIKDFDPRCWAFRKPVDKVVGG